MTLRTAQVIGSGPNGLAAAITLARAGVRVSVYEGRATLGGACSSAELTLPGFMHDRGSSAYPLGISSPFFRSLPLERFGFRWVQPELALAHPLEDGSAVALTGPVEQMTDELGVADGRAWASLFGPLVRDWQVLVPELLGPVVHVPRSPLALARFGLPALLPATVLARQRFAGVRARALFAGNAAHSVRPLGSALTSAFGLILGAAGHAVGWPVAGGGAQTLTDALAAYLIELGGTIFTGHFVRSLDELPPVDATFFDTDARALARIAGARLTPECRDGLLAFEHGAGAFKVDWALSGPIPWRAQACRRAGTVHVGGTLEEITQAEDEVFAGRHSPRPFVLVVQPSVCDPGRAPQGEHTAWGYCHVPNGSLEDQTEVIEAQIERFAPGFRKVIVGRNTQGTAELERWNPNLVGGDLSGGAMSLKQMVFRPSVREYGTSNEQIYLCSSATPPGGGVHGMCGFHAAEIALRRASRA